MSRLSLHLLGPPRIERDGEPVKVDTRKAIALLAYIAVTGESQRRAAIINLLWPEYERSRGRVVLRRTLYALRKALPGPWLQVDREEIRLGPEADFWVDVQAFHQRLAECGTHGHSASQVCPACAAPLTDAATLYRGDFMAGFGLKDSYNFDDWQLFQAEALRRELAGALERLELWHSSQRDFEKAIGYARRRLALDPLDEAAHQSLMQLYAWSGQRAAALRQYEACAGVLQDQLGVLPQSATTELFKAIKKGRGHSPPVLRRPRPIEAPGRVGVLQPVASSSDLFARLPSFLDKGKEIERPVFVARERELAQLDGFLKSALGGHGMVAFITGEAGSGKTALIQGFALRAQDAHPDLVVACGHGNAHTGIGDPYLPFREILGLLTGDVKAQWAAGAMTQDQARRLWRLLPQTVQALLEAGPDLIDLFVPAGALVKRAAATAPVGSGWLTQLEELARRKAATSTNPNLGQSALFEQYARVLELLAGQRPLLLVLDDLQWADRGSIHLLFHLGRRIAGDRILVVGAYRPAEVALIRPTASWVAMPIQTETLEKVEAAQERHPLAPVVNEFKRRFGDIVLDLERAEARQFVDAFLDCQPNRLGEAFRETLFQHTKGFPLFTIELLRGMQERGDLVQDEAGRWVEETALDWERLPARVEAVIAERIGFLPQGLRDILAIASVEGETFTAEVIARVSTADEAHIVRCLSDTLDRKHRLVSARGILRMGSQRLSQYRFRHILFQKYLYNSLDPVERAHLHQAVGNALERLSGEGAQAIAMQLARHFQEAGIYEKAIEYLKQAGDRAKYLYANDEAKMHYRRALANLEKMDRAMPNDVWPGETAASLYENLGEVHWLVSEYPNAEMAFREALARLPDGEPIWQARLYRKMGNLWRIQRRYDETLQAYQRAETALGDQPDDKATPWWREWIEIQMNRIWAFYWIGNWREVANLVGRIEPVVEGHGTLADRVNLVSATFAMQLRRDRYVVSDPMLASAYYELETSQKQADLQILIASQFEVGFAHLWRREFSQAQGHLQEALKLTERAGYVAYQSRILTYLTILYRMTGQIDEARRYASRSLAEAGNAQMVEYIGSAQANLAWVAWQAGKIEQAEAKARTALELWKETQLAYPFHWLALWPLVAIAIDHFATSDALEYARGLLEETQQALPERLTSVIEAAIRAWEGDERETAESYLHHAVELAQELGYL